MSCNLRIGKDKSYILVCHKDGLLFGGMRCSQLAVIVTLNDAINTEAIRKEEQDLLFSHESIFILKLMVDIQKIFKNEYLRKVDKSNALVSSVYGTADTTANEVSTLKTPEANAFLNSLKLDNNGNLLSDVTINGKKYNLLLSKHHKPTREKNKMKF